MNAEKSNLKRDNNNEKGPEENGNIQRDNNVQGKSQSARSKGYKEVRKVIMNIFGERSHGTSDKNQKVLEVASGDKAKNKLLELIEENEEEV